MGKIISWYNQNRKLLWIIILTILAIIALLQGLNNYSKDNTNDKSSSTNFGTTTYNKNNYSVVTQNNIDETTSDMSINLINNFFYYCNNGNIENAYSLLSGECKEELYPTIDDFKQKYINIFFTEKRSYDSTLWITTQARNTYRIQIMKDLLATGQKEEVPIEDYYTITIENGEYKLSIGSFIAKENVNKYGTINNLTINILSKTIYKDYEIYEIQLENNTKNNVIFNTKQRANSMYLQDENGLKYIAMLNEIPNSNLEILSGTTKTLEIKFNRAYKPTIDIKSIVFEDIEINDNQKQNVEIELQ